MILFFQLSLKIIQKILEKQGKGTHTVILSCSVNTNLCAATNMIVKLATVNFS